MDALQIFTGYLRGHHDVSGRILVSRTFRVKQERNIKYVDHAPRMYGVFLQDMVGAPNAGEQSGRPPKPFAVAWRLPFFLRVFTMIFRSILDPQTLKADSTKPEYANCRRSTSSPSIYTQGDVKPEAASDFGNSQRSRTGHQQTRNCLDLPDT